MIKLVTPVLLLIGGAFISSCTDKAAATDLKANEIPAVENVSKALYTVSTARANIQYYEKLLQGNSGDYVRVKAFTIRSEELLAAMGMSPALVNSEDCKFKNIRVYLGYDSLTGPKLFIVPVEGANLNAGLGGNDVFLNRGGVPVSGSANAKVSADGMYVLDLNTPCPNTCEEAGL